MGHLDGKIALVTGASAGIGEQTARTLADAGARVICAARRLPHLESLAAELGDAAIALELDVTDEDSVAKLLDRLPRDWRSSAISRRDRYSVGCHDRDQRHRPHACDSHCA